jgi:hypothetical protein
MTVSGGFEALFGLSALIAPNVLLGALGTEPNIAGLFLARVFGAATLGLGIAALLARDQVTRRAVSPSPMGWRFIMCLPHVSFCGLPRAWAERRYGAQA